MQEVIRGFYKWLDREEINYKDEFERAADLFWGKRSDLSNIIQSSDSEIFFNEWLMLDFSVSGYDGIPTSKRKNFMNVFLYNKEKQLSEAGKTFAKNISKSFPSFSRITGVKRGAYTNMIDLFSGKEIMVWDVNLSRSAVKGMIIHGRHCQNEEGKYIGAGAKVTFVPSPVFEILKHLINETFKMVLEEGEKITFPEFLKWNSYLYYREMMALINGNFGDNIKRDEPENRF